MLEAAVVIIVLAGMFFCLVKEIFSPELTVFLALAFLILIGIIPLEIAFEGFANPAVHTIGLLMVIAFAAQKSGVVPKLFARLLGSNKKLSVVLLKVMLSTSFLSSFFNNTPIVATLTPILYKWGMKNKIPPSKLLIPLSYAAIVGGTITLIGTSTNLLIHGLLQQSGHSGFSMFQFALIGLPLLGISILYMIFFGEKQLPINKDFAEFYQSTKQDYTVEVKVMADCAWIGKTVKEVNLRELNDIFLIQIIRDNHVITPVSRSEIISKGDLLVFSGNINSIFNLHSTKGLQFTITESPISTVKQPNIVEAVISHSSPLLNKKIKKTNFRAQYNCAIIAIRRNNHQISSGIGNIKMKPGDTLLLLTGDDFIRTWENSRDFYLVSGVTLDEIADPDKAPFIIPAILGVILLAALQILPILQSALLGVIVLVLTKSISTTEIKKAIDWGILILIASAIGIANAVEFVGLPVFVSELLNFEQPVHLITLCFLLYFSTLTLTELISNIAAAAFMFPIGFSLAAGLGYPVELMAMIIAISSSCSFITPIGYQTNLLVYGPGGYKFTDFFKIGFPLSMICMIVTVLLAVWIWA